MHVNAGSKIQSTPSKAGGDRYIPNRSTMQMEMANFLLTKENDCTEESPTQKVSVSQRLLRRFLKHLILPSVFIEKQTCI